MPVKVIAGCTATGRSADGGGRVEDGQAVPAGGVHDVLALVDGAAGAQHGDDVGQHVVGDGEQQHVAGAGDGGRLRDGYAGQQVGDPVAGGVGLTGGGDDLVAGFAERGGQDGADAAGADHADAASAWAQGCCCSCSNLSFQSLRRPAVRAGVGTGRVLAQINAESTRRDSWGEPLPRVTWATHRAQRPADHRSEVVDEGVHVGLEELADPVTRGWGVVVPVAGVGCRSRSCCAAGAPPGRAGRGGRAPHGCRRRRSRCGR